MTHRPIRRPTDCCPDFMLREYRRLASLPDPLVRFKIKLDPEDYNFSCNLIHPTFISRYMSTGSDHAGLQATVSWLREGPKIADVTEEQYQALSRVEVRLTLADFTMPYPTVLVNMPPGKMHQYVILHKRDVPSEDGSMTSILIGASISTDNQHDIITICRCHEGHDVEESLGTFDSEVSETEGEAALAAMRVACNLMLAMTNFGFQAAYLFPAEVEAERKFVAKGNRVSKSGLTASMRLAEQPKLVTLNREVKLYHREGSHEAGESTGREMPFHWRRGHWRKARVGVGRQETRLTFIRPCMVRADLLHDLPCDTTTTYKKG